MGKGGRPEPGKRFTFQAPPRRSPRSRPPASTWPAWPTTMRSTSAGHWPACSLPSPPPGAPTLLSPSWGSGATSTRRSGRHEPTSTARSSPPSARRSPTPTRPPTPPGSGRRRTLPRALPTPSTLGACCAPQVRPTVGRRGGGLHALGGPGPACPGSSQRSLAVRLVEAGADVVVGSHAHLLQGDGRLRDGYVAYGLGNYAWYTQSSEPTPVTGVLTLTVRPPVSPEGRARVTDAAWGPASIGADGLPGPWPALLPMTSSRSSPRSEPARPRALSRKAPAAAPGARLGDLGRRGRSFGHEQHVVLLAALPVAQQRHHADPARTTPGRRGPATGRPTWARPRPRRRPPPPGRASPGSPASTAPSAPSTSIQATRRSSSPRRTASSSRTPGTSTATCSSLRRLLPRLAIRLTGSRARPSKSRGTLRVTGPLSGPMARLRYSTPSRGDLVAVVRPHHRVRLERDRPRGGQLARDPPAEAGLERADLQAERGIGQPGQRPERGADPALQLGRRQPGLVRVDGARHRGRGGRGHWVNATTTRRAAPPGPAASGSTTATTSSGEW